MPPGNPGCLIPVTSHWKVISYKGQGLEPMLLCFCPARRRHAENFSVNTPLKRQGAYGYLRGGPCALGFNGGCKHTSTGKKGLWFSLFNILFRCFERKKTLKNFLICISSVRFYAVSTTCLFQGTHPELL